MYLNDGTKVELKRALQNHVVSRRYYKQIASSSCYVTHTALHF